MRKAGPPLSPLKHLWLAALPILPLILATMLVSSLINPDAELAFLEFDTGKYLASPLRDYRHLGDMLIYYALASIHGVLCFGVIAFFLHMMRKLPAQQRWNAAVFSVAIFALLLGLIFYFEAYANEIVLVQLGYKATCLALQSAPLPTDLVESCFEDNGINKLTLLAWVPTFSGMGAVVFAAAFALGNADAMPKPSDPSWHTVVEQRTKALQMSVYALSAVLVSSTITITLFAHLPIGLLADESDLAKAISHYASGLSTFWGALFSLTLLATFAAPTFLLLRRAYAQEAATTKVEDLRAWLHEHVFVSIKKQLLNAASLLAPLLVGPLSSLFSSLAGAG